MSSVLSTFNRKVTPLFMAFLFLATQVASTVAIAVLASPTALAGPNDITASTHQGQLKPSGTYSSGNITEYTELDSINFRFNIDSSDPASGKMQVEFTSNDTGCLFFDGTLVLGTHTGGAALTNVTGTAPIVTLDGAAINNGSDWIQRLNVEFVAAGSATVNYYLTLTDEAGECSSGSPQHSRLANVAGAAGGDFKNIGNQNVPIPSNQIIELPEIFVEKWVDVDGDGQVDRKALAGEWSFSLNGGTPVPTDSNGNVTFLNVTPNGNHTITEVNGPTGQSFISGGGTNCMFNGSTATANIASGTTSKNATCIFNNGVRPGSITIVKDAKPNRAQDFTFLPTGSNLPASFMLDDDDNATLPNQRVFSNLTTGTYSFTEQAVAGWDLKDITCTGGSSIINGATATINLAAGDNVTCTFTNVKRGSVTVNKVTNPANDPTLFPVNISGSGTINGATSGNISTSQSVTFDISEGSYSVSETVPAGWAMTGNTCTENNLTFVVTNTTTEAELNRTCTITNTKLANLIIKKDAVPNDGQDFEFSTNFGQPNFFLDDDDDATLSNEKVFNGLMPGQAYGVTELSIPGWQLTGLVCDNGAGQQGATASVTPNAGQTVTCTFTNTKLGSISGFKYEVNADGTVVTSLSGWTIELLLNGELYGNTETTGDGSYSFGGLLPGNYTIRELQQAGYTQITPSDPGTILEVLTAGENSTENNFGNFENGSISGLKFNDRNGDGVQQEGEENLTGWTIRLFKSPDNVTPVATDVTDANGYSFTDLSPGTYQVCEVQQMGWAQTFPDNNSCHDIVINNSGETNDNTNFGNQGRGSIQVIKNVDTDGDGQVDEENVNTWTWDIYGSGNFATGTSQPVAAGTYDVSEDQKEDFSVVSATCNNIEGSSAVESLEVTVQPGETVICTFTNARDTGTITVNKILLPADDDGEFNLLIDGEIEATVSAEDETMTTGEVRVTTGDHSVSETAAGDTDLDNYIQLIGGDCAEDGSVTVEKGEDKICTITNTRKATLTIVKEALPNDAQDFNFTIMEADTEEIELDNLTNNTVLEAFELFQKSFVLDDDDDATLSNTEATTLNPGSYTVSEEAVDGWNLESIFCDNAIIFRVDNTMNIEVEPGDDVTCTFVNVKDAQITVTKFLDSNLNGELDEDEALLPDWDMTLTSENCLLIGDIVRFEVTDKIDNGYCYDLLDHQDSTTQTTGEDGTTTFEGVKPFRTHTLQESLEGKDGWNWSNTYCIYPELDDRLVAAEVSDGELVEENNYRIYPSPGAEIECFVGNFRDAELLLEKSNDQPTPTVAGDSVVYTLTVTLPEDSGNVYDGIVTDLPPENFKYVPGSWTASSSVRGDLKMSGETTEPTYASPGDWQLGDMIPGEVVTLTYLAQILTNVTPGEYPDQAFVRAADRPVEGETIFGNVQLPAATPFVGTQVAVIQPDGVVSFTASPAQVLAQTGESLHVAAVIAPILLLAATVLAIRSSRPDAKKGARR